jgi:hypothetical protein
MKKIPSAVPRSRSGNQDEKARYVRQGARFTHSKKGAQGQERRIVPCRCGKAREDRPPDYDARPRQPTVILKNAQVAVKALDTKLIRTDMERQIPHDFRSRDGDADAIGIGDEGERHRHRQDTEADLRGAGAGTIHLRVVVKILYEFRAGLIT